MSVVSATIDILEAFVIAAVPTGTIYPRYQCKVDPADLPVFIILPQGATHTHESFRNYATTREYIIYMLVAGICDDKSQEQEIARESAFESIDTIVNYFAAHPMLADQSTGIVVDATLPRENGVQLTSWGGDEFTAIEFRTSVTTSKEVST